MENQWQHEVSEKLGKLTRAVEDIDKKMSNHLEHHFWIEVSLLAPLIGAVITVLCLVFK